MKRHLLTASTPPLPPRLIRLLAMTTTGMLIFTGCSTFSHRTEKSGHPELTESQKIDRLQTQNKELMKTISSLGSKIDILQSKLNQMNRKVDTAQSRLDNLVSNEVAKPAPVKPRHVRGAVKLPPVNEVDNEAAFVSDVAVRKYRQAMILFDSHNYPDAILAFSSFVDQFPDHALAGSAQYYMGESYLKQGEYKLATRELQRVITSYDRSPHISDTLLALSKAEARIGETEEASRHRKLLTSIFPNSPAAASLREMENALENDTHAGQTQKGTPTDDNLDAPPSTVSSQPTSQGNNTNPGIKASASSETHLDAPPPTAPMTPTGTPEQENGNTSSP